MRTISSPRRITGLLTDKSDKAASVYDCPNSLTAIHDSSMARLRDRCSRRLCTASSLAYSPRRACTSPRPMAARSTRRACVTRTRRRHHRGQHNRGTPPARPPPPPPPPPPSPPPPPPPPSPPLL